MRALPDVCIRLLRTADAILHAGDFVSVAFFEELQRLGPPLEAVAGNMDEPDLKAVLPQQRVVKVGSLRIGMVHNAGPRAGREARLAARFEDCDAVVYGHTHVPEAARHGSAWILNPGSPTERRRARGHSMLVLDVEEESPLTRTRVRSSMANVCSERSSFSQR